MSSANNNKEIINEIFDAKLQIFQSEGFFPGLYQPSLHATYYAVYTICSLGRNSYLDVNSITDFIIAHFNNNTNLFEDTYSKRYLDSDFDPYYFPLTTVLEVNCYAILTLDLLGQSDLIEVQDAIDFIWSCYNPNEGGFIGRPYDTNLEEGFKLPTIDNTYHAIMTLNLLLGGDWSEYSQEINEIIIFINDLQNFDGSFENDPDSLLRTSPFYEPNPVSAYQALKVLELFNAGDTIDLEGLRSYLESLFDTDNDYFKITPYSGYDNQAELVASAVCIEIADIITLSLPEYDRALTLQFILNNRNGLGTWDDGLQGNYHELWYTYLIIRALSDSGSLSLLASQDSDEIVAGLSYYYDGIGGYSLMSSDYTPVKTIHSIVSSFIAEGKYNELNLLEKEAIYNSLLNAHKTTLPGHSTFFYCIGIEQNSGIIKTRPVDFFYAGTQEHLRIPEFTMSHKNTYLTLDSLYKMVKLDDLNDKVDVNLFIDNVNGSQLLDPVYDECGGFAFYDSIPSSMPDQRTKTVYFEQSYYALKVVELLTDFQETDIYSTPIDLDAYIAYIYRNIQNSPSMTWVQPENVYDTETILKNTYFAIDALQVLDAYALNDQKILNFIMANINYNNIQNIYYCYKIIQALGVENILDYDLVNQLIPLIYDDSIAEFYLTPNRMTPCQEAIWWICEMANSDIVKAEISYDNPLYLGTNLNMSVEVKSLIYDLEPQYYNVYFKSDLFGDVALAYQDPCYFEELFVTFDPENYPQISGNICVYKGGEQKINRPVIINTAYETSEEFSKSLRSDGGIDFSGTARVIIDGESLPAGLYGFKARVDIYKDGAYIESRYMTSSGITYSDCTEFSLEYEPDENGEYFFKIYYEDPFKQAASIVLNATLSYTGSAGVMAQANAITIPGAIILAVILGASSSGVLVFSSKKRGVLHKKFNR